MAKTDNIIPMMFNIPADALVESDKAQLAGRYLSERDMLVAPAEAPGLLPMAKSLYATRDLKADPNHNNAEVLKAADDNRARYATVRPIIVARIKAVSIGAKATAFATANARAEAEYAAAQKVAKSA